MKYICTDDHMIICLDLIFYIKSNVYIDIDIDIDEY